LAYKKRYRKIISPPPLSTGPIGIPNNFGNHELIYGERIMASNKKSRAHFSIKEKRMMLHLNTAR